MSRLPSPGRALEAVVALLLEALPELAPSGAGGARIDLWLDRIEPIPRSRQPIERAVQPLAGELVFELRATDSAALAALGMRVGDVLAAAPLEAAGPLCALEPLRWGPDEAGAEGRRRALRYRVELLLPTEQPETSGVIRTIEIRESVAADGSSR